MRVHMWVMGQRRGPGVEHRGRADPGAGMLGIGGDAQERLGGGLEQDAVDLSLVLIGDAGDGRRQGEDDVEVFHPRVKPGDQQLGLARGEPVLGGGALALGAVPGTPAVARCLRRTQPAGVGQASGEETAGGLGSAVRAVRSMGI